MANLSSQHARFGSGKAVRRVEDEALLTGKGRFADDVNAAGEAHVAFLRSPHPHARIAAIDTAAAAAFPGVIAVITGEDLVRAGVKPLLLSADFRRADGSPTATPPRHALALGVVRHVGEAVAAVVAESVGQAQDAIEAIDVRYEPLPMVVEVARAVAAGAPLVWNEASGNIACEFRHGDAEATAAAFRKAAHVVRLDLLNQRVAPCPIEPRATLATYDANDGAADAHRELPDADRDCATSSPRPCSAFRRSKVRVLVGDVGGGFGMKTNLYPEDVVAAFCARQFKRPVKWCASRMDEFLAASHGRDLTSTAELALDKDGRVLALRVDSLANVGAYATGGGVVIQLMIGPWVATSVYDIGTVDIRIQAVLTHTAPTGAYRGAGRPEAIYMIERLMDAAARATGIDQVELRRRNMIAPSQMPYRNPLAKTYDSGQFASVMDQALALSTWNGIRRAARRRETPRAPARPRDGRVSRMDGRRRVRGGGHRHRGWRWRHRNRLGDAGDGAGPRDDVRAARGRRLRRADRKDPHRAGRHGPRDGVRQRGFALAVRRRLGGEGRGGADGREGAGPRCAGARGGGRRPRVCGRRVRASPAPTGASIFSSLRGDNRDDASDSSRRAPSPTRRGRTPATSARSRSTPTPEPSRSPGTGR